MAAARFFISGLVQGVAFRYYASEQARALGIAGYARNLRDGRVEVLALGEPAQLELLAQWLERGPPAARVERVERQPAASTEWRGSHFETG
jgi:acylphosphatase